MPIVDTTVPIEQLPASLPGSADYTVAASTTAKIVHAVATNIHASNSALLTVTIADAGGDDSVYIDAKAIPVGKSYLCPELVGQNLKSTDEIKAFSDATSQINLRISIRETT